MSEKLNGIGSKPETAGLSEAVSEIEFLANTQNRFEILDCLRNSQYSSADLKEELQIPQTTLRRNLHELEEKNWIRRSPTENTYSLTPAGKLIISQFHKMIKQIQHANRIGEFYSRLPESVPVSGECLHSCPIACAKTYDPYNPTDKLINVLESATRFRGYAPMLNPRCIETFSLQTQENGKGRETEFEFVTTPRMINILRAKQSPTTGLFSDGCNERLFISEELPSFGVCITDQSTIIFVYDRNQRIHSLMQVNNSQGDVIDWTEQQYSHHRQQAMEYSYDE